MVRRFHRGYGDLSQSWVPRQDLTGQERKKLQAIREELAAINKQIGNENDEVSARFSGMHLPENKAAKARVNELEKEVAQYLAQKEVTKESGGRTYTTRYSPYHGLVWVYLRK